MWAHQSHSSINIQLATMRRSLQSVVFGFLMLATAEDGDLEEKSPPHPFGPLVTEFSLTLLKNLTKSSSQHDIPINNTLFSPSSLYKSMLELYLGCQGDSQAQMARALHIESVEFNITENYTAWRDSDPTEVLEGNRLFHSRDADVKEGFKDLVKNDIYGIPSGSPASQVVNEWASKVTQGNVTGIVGDVEVDPTRLLLASVAYNKPDWATPLPVSEIGQNSFTLSDGTTKSNVIFMRTIRQFGYYESFSLRSKVIELNYKTPRLCFVIFLPNTNQTVSGLINLLTVSEIEGSLRNLSQRRTSLQLPTFRTEQTLNLTSLCGVLGVCDVFTTDKAGMTGITGQPGVHLGDARQKVFLNVTEKKGSMSPGRGPPEHFDADHPFVYMVYDKTSKMPLLMGTVMDPQQ